MKNLATDGMVNNAKCRNEYRSATNRAGGKEFEWWVFHVERWGLAPQVNEQNAKVRRRDPADARGLTQGAGLDLIELLAGLH